LWAFHLYEATAYGVSISQLIRYSRACGSYYDILDRRLLLTRKLLNQGFLVVMLKHSLRSFTVATMTWFTVAEYLCHKWPWIYSGCRIHNRCVPYSWLITRCVAIVTRRVPQVEQELLTLPEHLHRLYR